MHTEKGEKMTTRKPVLNEDWLAVILAFAIILLAALQILGKNGINITF